MGQIYHHTMQILPEQISLHSNTCGHKRRTNLRAVTASTFDSAVVSHTNFYARHATFTYRSQPFHSIQPHSVLFHWVLELHYHRSYSILGDLCLIRTQPKPKAIKYVHHGAVCQKLLG
jgi:hypothetical protein